MIKIRRSTFETNSSSTHSLIIKNIKTYNNEELKALNKTMKIKNLPSTDTPQHFVYYSTLEEKLSYLFTAYLQCRGYIDEDYNLEYDYSNAGQFFKLLKEICPNTEFIEIKTKNDSYYFLEDLDNLMADYYNEEFDKFINKDVIINLLLDGEIINVTRDDWELNEKLDKKCADAEISISIAG